MGWESFQKDGLRNGLKGAASDALKDSEKYKALDVP
jgi:hypothetical protein